MRGQVVEGQRDLPRRGPRPDRDRGGGAKDASLGEERKRDRLGHRAIAGFIRMKMVPRIISGQQPIRMCRIADRRVEIDHRIERAGGPG